MYPIRYTRIVYQVVKTEEFDRWLRRLRDEKAKARIAARIRSAEYGNLGDIAPVGGGVSEIRIHFGPGYRIYFMMGEKLLIILLLGGDKSSQRKDIEKAKVLADEINKQKEYDQPD